MTQLIIVIVLIAVGYYVGSSREKKHYKSIIERENRYLKILPTINMKSINLKGREVKKVKLVTGSVVISIDYFKMISASLRNLFGGRISTFESLIDRARREAILRMKQNALGADIVINLKIETSSIANSQNRKNRSVTGVEALVSGTAIYFEKEKTNEVHT